MQASACCAVCTCNRFESLKVLASILEETPLENGPPFWNVSVVPTKKTFPKKHYVHWVPNLEPNLYHPAQPLSSCAALQLDLGAPPLPFALLACRTQPQATAWSTTCARSSLEAERGRMRVLFGRLRVPETGSFRELRQPLVEHGYLSR